MPLIDLQLVPRAIAREELDVDFTLATFREEDFLACLLKTATEVAASPAAAFISQIVPCAKMAVDLARGVAQSAASIKANIDDLLDTNKVKALGRCQQTRCAPMPSGTFAFIANGESTNELAYDPHTNTLSNAKEPVAAPYAIVRLMCETTRAGQSGPRVYVRSEAGQYGAPQIAGVHAYGEGSTPGAIGLANSGVWIDADMLTKILAWSGK